MRPTRLARQRGEQGAMLVQVAVALVAMFALSALAIDYGVIWAGRREAQNAADSAALTAAIHMSFVKDATRADAQSAAVAMAQQHTVWAGAPSITTGDVTFPPCPPGSPGVPDTCVRVELFRNQARGNPLPVFFSRFAGVVDQGVRATATAQMIVADRATCVKPWAVPDKWIDRLNSATPYSPPYTDWSPDDSFEHYVQNGNNAGAEIPNFDIYVPPSGTPPGPNGEGPTGFTVEDNWGWEFMLKPGNPNQAIRPGWYFPVVINPLEGPGGDNYRDNIAECDPTEIGPGTVLEVEPGNMIGPTNQGVQALLDQDLGAHWVPGVGIVGGCMSTGGCDISPRWVALPVFNVDAYNQAAAGGRTEINVVKILGFFIDRIESNDVYGYLTFYPALNPSTEANPNETFLRKVILVR